MQAQCWFWVCLDCQTVIESIREVHCDGAMRGLEPNPAAPEQELADDYERNEHG